MILFHVSPSKNRSEISRWGLLKSAARGRRKAVWLVTEERLHWAFCHVQRTHGVKLEDIDAIEVDCSGVKLCLGPVSGTLYTETDLDAGHLIGFTTYPELMDEDMKQEEEYETWPLNTLPGGNGDR